MKIQVLGTGCRKCMQLHENVLQALRRADRSAEVAKVTDLAEIAGLGVYLTPALAIDGKVVFTGRVADVDELMRILEKHAS
jgi:small redox-active disulfide protein 2